MMNKLVGMSTLNAQLTFTYGVGLAWYYPSYLIIQDLEIEITATATERASS